MRYDNEASVSEAIELLEGLIESEGESADRCADLGRAYLRKYQLTLLPRWETKAESSCRRALELDADSHRHAEPALNICPTSGDGNTRHKQRFSLKAAIYTALHPSLSTGAGFTSRAPGGDNSRLPPPKERPSGRLHVAHSR